MRKLHIKIAIIFCLILNISLFAQLTRITSPTMMSEANIYQDANGNEYSTMITFKFKSKMVNIARGQKTVNETGILHSNFKGLLGRIRAQYGNFVINKTVPDVQWEDSLKVNKRTNQIVHVVDLSQIYRLVFTSPVPVNQVVNMLKSNRNVLYAEGPIIAYETLSPNDPYYADPNYRYNGTTDYRWSFNAISAEGAWDITKGSPLIGIGIDDSFGGVNQLHEDLVGKVVWDNLNGNYGGHGIITAGVAGALTNNNTDIASLGWNINLLLNRIWGWSAADGIYQLVQNGADVINFSWITTYPSPSLSDAVLYALQQGRVCVAAAGNDEFVPYPLYPAAFNFGSTGQVIAVSGTELVNGVEKFISTFNYSPGTDPINDPTNAFIDCAAQGANYRGLSNVSATGTVHIWYGTSISSPFVSAMVGLMLSVNSTLTPVQVYDIIKQTSDKIGTHPYDANGWNQYLGYGRINAANAVNVATGAPAEPRGLTIAWYGNHPKLTWDTNLESDVTSYKIWKYAAGSSMIAATVTNNPNNSTQSWIDNDVTPSGKFDPHIEFQYKVKAIDNTNKESIYSDVVSITGNGGIWKISNGNNESAIADYKLFANYPNPFNPSTKIEFQIPQSAFVNLTVYNSLGQRVATLVKSKLDVGSYTADFNAENLLSGIYIYKIQAGKFFNVKKMILLK